MTKSRRVADLINQRTQNAMPEDAFETGQDDELVNSLKQITSQSTAIMKTGHGQLEIEGCQANAAGLIIPNSISATQIDNVIETLFMMENHVQLWIGDMLVAYEDALRYGDITALAARFNRDGKTLRNWKSICKSVKTSSRQDVLRQARDRGGEVKPLTIGHYNLLTAFDDRVQQELMLMALLNQWSVRQLQSAIQAKDGVLDSTRTGIVERAIAQQDKVLEKVRIRASKKNARKRWLSFAQQQSEKWLELADEIENME